jgi:hypothetical protein
VGPRAQDGVYQNPPLLTSSRTGRRTKLAGTGQTDYGVEARGDLSLRQVEGSEGTAMTGAGTRALPQVLRARLALEGLSIGDAFGLLIEEIIHAVAEGVAQTVCSCGRARHLLGRFRPAFGAHPAPRTMSRRTHSHVFRPYLDPKPGLASQTRPGSAMQIPRD